MATVEYDFEAPVWWDPKVRRSIWKHKTFRLGLLLVRDDVVTVASTRGVVCSAPFDGLRVEWPEVFGLPMCDLRIDDDTYRLYFCSPHPRGPQFHARVPTAVTAVLESRGDARVRLATARTPAARWPSQLTEPMGRKRMIEFRTTVEQPAGGAPDRRPSPAATSAPLHGTNDSRPAPPTPAPPGPSG